jgi:hypothetical protein
VVVLSPDAADLAAALALGVEIKKYVDHLDGAFLNAGIAGASAKAWCPRGDTRFRGCARRHYGPGLKAVQK